MARFNRGIRILRRKRLHVLVIPVEARDLHPGLEFLMESVSDPVEHVCRAGREELEELPLFRGGTNLVSKGIADLEIAQIRDDLNESSVFEESLGIGEGERSRGTWRTDAPEFLDMLGFASLHPSGNRLFLLCFPNCPVQLQVFGMFLRTRSLMR